MQLGIIGLPNSGKTTVFNALTGSNQETGAVSSGKMTLNTAVVSVPDERVDKLSAMFKPKKTVYTTVTYVDVGGLDKGISKSGIPGPLKNALGPLDGLVHVVRVFKDETVPHPQITIDPQRDIDTLDAEFYLTDLLTIEARLERLDAEMKKKGKKAVDLNADEELELLNRMKEHLEQEKPLREMDVTEDEKQLVRGYGLLSLKPMVIVLNTDEPVADPSTIAKYTYKNSVMLAMPAKIEAEIAQLSPDDRQMFLEEYGITDPAAHRVIMASYDLMSIQSFFTVGEDEVRAWSVGIGSTAPQAAGAIHSDLQRGFIRAEVTAYEDLINLGSMAKAKTEGKHRLEGKEYIVKDGDILNIRFSV